MYPSLARRALADQWIEVCDQQYAEREAAASASAVAASSAAAAAASEAAQAAANKGACEAIGGQYKDDGWTETCVSTVGGNPSGEPFKECSRAYIWLPATERDLAQLAADYPGCFG